MATRLVLCPGLIGDRRMWDDVALRLKDCADIAIVEYNDLDSIAAMAARAIDAAGGQEFAIAGISMGGYVAMEALRQAGHKITHAAFISTTPSADSPARKKQREQDIAAGPEAFAAKRKDPKHFQFFLSPSHAEGTDIIDTMRAMETTAGYESFVNHAKACMGRPDSTDFLKTLTIPSLVFAGTDDQLFPPAAQFAFFSLLQNADFALVKNCGHFSTAEQPGMVANSLKHLLTR